MKRRYTERILHDLQKTRGVTLLELIISMSMFAIAAIVLLQGFMSAGRVNKKTEETLRATELAQNIMEEVRAKGLEETSLAFNYPIDLQQNGQSRFYFLRGLEEQIQQKDGIILRELIQAQDSNQYEAVRKYQDGMESEDEVTSSILSKDEGKTWEFVRRTKGKNRFQYFFEIEQIKEGKHMFDVLVQFDGSKHSGYKKDDENYVAEDEKNDYVAPNIAKLDTKENAFLIMEQNWDKDNVEAQILNPYNAYREKKGEATLTYEELWQHTKRTLIVSVEQEEESTVAKGQYELDMKDYLDSEYTSMVTEEAYRIKSTPFTFYSSEIGKELKQVYIFYYPNYDCLQEGVLDQIIVENEKNLPLTVSIVKQKRENGTIPSTLQEEQYEMDLLVKETPAENGHSNWFANSGLFHASTKILTNLDQNIAQSLSSDQERTTQQQANITFQDAKTGRHVFGNTAKQVLQWNELEDRTEKETIYDVTVSVYRAGAAQHNFEEQPLITWDSAKDD